MTVVFDLKVANTPTYWEPPVPRASQEPRFFLRSQTVLLAPVFVAFNPDVLGTSPSRPCAEGAAVLTQSMK